MDEFQLLSDNYAPKNQKLRRLLHESIEAALNLRPFLSRANTPRSNFDDGATVYLVAKHIPDLRRGEAVNFGVVVVQHDVAAAKFLGEKNGQVIAAHLPAKLQHPEAVREWASYWRRSIRSPLQDTQAAMSVLEMRPRLLDRLIQSGKSDFFLECKGEIIDAADPRNLQEVCDYLFQELVGDTEFDLPVDNVEIISRRFIKNYGLASDKRLRTNAEIRLALNQTVHAHYAFGEEGAYEAIYQRIPWAPQKANFEPNVLAAFGLFKKLSDTNVATKEKLGALINLDIHQMKSEDMCLIL